jgi:hypothetical protein
MNFILFEKIVSYFLNLSFRTFEDPLNNLPDFAGNFKDLTSKLLFSIIMGHIVLPKKNPILIEDYVV